MWIPTDTGFLESMDVEGRREVMRLRGSQRQTEIRQSGRREKI